MIKKKNKKTRFYLFSNIIFLLGIFGILFFSLKISYKETSTGIYFKKISNGTGKSIENFMEEVYKETKDEKNNDVNKKEKHHVKKPKVLLRVERSIFFKGEIIEYPGSSFNNLLLLDYERVKKNNYCCDLIECVNFLKNIGDKYIFRIKANDLGLEGGEKIRPDDYVCVELELVELFTSDNMLAKYFGLYSEFIQKTNNRIKQEKELITRYLNNIGREYKNAGDYYLVIDDNGRGQYIKNGDKVKFNYSIKEHGGNIIDTNIKDIALENDIFSNKNEYKPIEIEIKLNSSSPLQCLKFLKKGGQGKIYYPFSISGELGKIMIPLFLIRFIVSPLSITLIVFEKQKFLLFWQIGLVVFTVLPYIMSMYNDYNIYQYIYSMTLFIGLYYVLYFFIIYYVIRQNNG